MGTRVNVSYSAAQESGVDILEVLTGLGYTVDNSARIGAVLAVILVEDLNTREIKKVKKAMDKVISNVSVEVFDSEALAIAKERYEEVIDTCSEYIIRAYGFEWPPTSGQRFSLSTNAQIKWMGLDLARNDLTYPKAVPTKDNDGAHSIADATEVHNMYLTAAGTIDAILAGGTAKKQEVGAAVSKAVARQLAVDYLNSAGCSELVSDLGP